MNTCVSDEQIIVNIQGIRNVKWGESTEYNYGKKGSWFVTITYKGSHDVFYYRTESEARLIFNKIREAMDKSYKNAT